RLSFVYPRRVRLHESKRLLRALVPQIIVRRLEFRIDDLNLRRRALEPAGPHAVFLGERVGLDLENGHDGEFFVGIGFQDAGPRSFALVESVWVHAPGKRRAGSNRDGLDWKIVGIELDEPSLHRPRFAGLVGDSKAESVVSGLAGFVPNL